MCRDLSTGLGLLPDLRDMPDKDWDPFSPHAGLWSFSNFTFPSKLLDAAEQRQVRLDDEARNAARAGLCGDKTVLFF